MGAFQKIRISGWNDFSRFFIGEIFIVAMILCGNGTTTLSGFELNPKSSPTLFHSFVKNTQPLRVTKSNKRVMLSESERSGAVSKHPLYSSIQCNAMYTDIFFQSKNQIENSVDETYQSNLSQKENPKIGFFQLGEEMTYEVSYLLIHLGTITTKVIAIDKVNGKSEFKAEVHIKSYKGIPFTNINTIFQSTINDQMYSTSFGTKEYYKDTTWKYINYTYNWKKDVVYISERIGNQKIMQNYDTLKMEGKHYQDGLSLLFFARANAFAKYEEHVPTLIYKTKADTYIRFGQERTSVNIDAVDYPVDVIKIDGDAVFTGIFGLTGGFKGWFSSDSASVPIFAQMRVYVGNVNIELIKWKRPGWGPPRYQEK